MPLLKHSNINKKMGNIAKFYGWLEVNETTPIEIKLLVLDNCMFCAILHGVEAWGDINSIEKKIRTFAVFDCDIKRRFISRSFFQSSHSKITSEKQQ